MFISQLMNIGKVIPSKSKYETLVDNQKKYFRTYFINVILDVDNFFEKVDKIQLEEFDEDKNYDYGFGITTGSGSLFSPSFNIKWDDIKSKELFEKNLDNHFKVINFEKLFLMQKKSNIEETDFYVKKFLEFLRTSEKPYTLRKQIVEELYREFIEKKVPNAKDLCE